MVTFHKYPKIKILGSDENKYILSDPDDEIIVEEKIDGANFRALPIWDEEKNTYRIVYGSRNQSIGDSASPIGGTWSRAVEYLNDVLLPFASPLRDHILYFEYTIPHTLSHDWENIPVVIGLDIMDPDGRMVDYDDKLIIFSQLGISPAPLIYRGSVKHFVMMTDDDIPQSKFGLHQAEGIVIKNYTRQLMAKFVRAQFKESNSKVFGKPKSAVSGDVDRLISSYCTNPRIDKKIFQLINDGNELDMPLMQWLPNMVWDDIIEEHWKDILTSNWCIDIRVSKKKTAARCIEVLKQRITERAVHAQRG